MNATPAERPVVRRTVFMCLAVFLAHMTYGRTLESQSSAIVSGTVTAANSMPVAQAKVALIGTNISTVTRFDGVFRVSHVPAGPQTIEVRMVGYRPTILPFDVQAGETLHLMLVLDPLALETVKVTADANFSPGMGGFEERRGHGNGKFFNRADIEKMQARQVTDVLRRVPGMRIQGGTGPFGGSQTAQTGRNAGSAGSRICPMAYYLNGTPFPLSNDVSINHYVTPDEVVAMEVYTGASQIPAEFNSTITTSRCGVVVIWTRIGVDARVSR